MNNQTRAETIRSKIDKFLEDRSITFDAIGTGYHKDDNSDWEYHRFTCSLDRQDHRPSKIEITFKQGLGIDHDPAPTDLLYSLINDLTWGMGFEKWADNLGYDTDSRKAEKIYYACLDQEKQTLAMFSESEIIELQKLLQDY